MTFLQFLNGLNIQSRHITELKKKTISAKYVDLKLYLVMIYKLTDTPDYKKWLSELDFFDFFNAIGINKVNKKMFKELSRYGIKIDKVYFCPHNITENCNCRKPKIGLMERAQKDLNIDKKKSFMIGDKTQDIKVGENFGCKTILVKTGYAGKDKEFEVKPDFIARDLIDRGLKTRQVAEKATARAIQGIGEA